MRNIYSISNNDYIVLRVGQSIAINTPIYVDRTRLHLALNVRMQV